MNREQRRAQERGKLKVTVNAKAVQREAQNWWAILPERALKGLVAFLFFLPLTMISFGVVCFQKNEWPWSNKL